MDNNDGRPSAGEGAVPAAETGGDWRTQLTPESRRKVVYKVMDSLKKHCPFSGQEELEEIKKTAMRFEEKIYFSSANQPDYMRKISMKLLTIDTKFQDIVSNSLPSNSSGNNSRAPDSGASHNMLPQIHNQGQSLSMPMSTNLSQGHQQTSISSIVGESSTMQNISGIPHNSAGNSMGQGIPSNMFANSQRQMPGRQQVVPQQQQQQIINPQKYLFQQPPLNQKLQQQGHLQHTLVQSHMKKSLLPSQQQKHLMSQQPNATNMQQNQLMVQQNVGDMQHQQQRLMGQQNNLQILQQHQELMAQKKNLSSVHQQQLGSQINVSGLRQQLPGTQSGNSTMQSNQHPSLHMMQRPKIPLQQQISQNVTNMFPTQGEQSQERLVSQMQSQPTQLQQQPNPTQREMQPALQASIQPPSSLLQQQNVIDQQKQLYQSQRPIHETSSTSIDYVAQTGNLNGGDWREEIHQKIKAMKEMYLPELNELYQRFAPKVQQYESLPQPPKSEQFDRLKTFKINLERMIAFLQVPKNNITPGLKEKLGLSEKQIINLIFKARKSIHPLQQGPLGQPHKQQPQQSLVSEVQSHENQMNPQLPSMNMQGSVQNMWHNKMNSVQTVSSSDSGLGMGSMQKKQTAVGHLQQNTVIMHSQQLKQHQMNQQLMKPQIMQPQKQTKQHLAAQMQACQMSQAHQMKDVNELKIRQGMGVKPGVFQQHISGQRTAYTHQEMKPGVPFPVSSPQFPQTASPQFLQHSSPQVDQKHLLSSLSKAGTPLQSANSPSIVPSPSTPLAPSTIPGDSEKPLPGISSLSKAAGNVGQQQVTATQPPAPSLAISTPGISASPLLAEFTISDAGGHVDAAGTIVSDKSNVADNPIERLIKAVKSVSSQALSAAVSDISNVVSMMDRMAGSAPGNGSRAGVGEDLGEMSNFRLQGTNFIARDGTTGARKMMRYTSAHTVSSSCSVSGQDTPDSESTASSSFKRCRIEPKHDLLEEISEINLRLIDTVVDVCDEDVDPTVATKGSEGTIVKCSYIAVALSPDLKAHYASGKMTQIQPIRLLVPSNYPNCSPIILDMLPDEVSEESEDLSAKARSRFGRSLRCLSEPMTVKEMARTWDTSARAVISEYAQQRGGGTFSSIYGTWEDCRV